MQLNPFSSKFYQNPADKAMPYLNEIPNTISPYYNPYINAGRDSLATLLGQFDNLIKNPGSVMADIGKGFTESPGYQFQYNQGMNAINNAAASGGMLGTPSHQQNAAAMATNTANQDYYNYLSTALGLYGQGLGGHQNLNNLGYGASNELANSLGNNLMNQGNLAYLGQANQNQSNANLFNQLMGLGSTLGGIAIGKFGMPKPNQMSSNV